MLFLPKGGLPPKKNKMGYTQLRWHRQRQLGANGLGLFSGGPSTTVLAAFDATSAPSSTTQYEMTYICSY
jgi:hypothetical protein